MKAWFLRISTERDFQGTRFIMNLYNDSPPMQSIARKRAPTCARLAGGFRMNGVIPTHLPMLSIMQFSRPRSNPFRSGTGTRTLHVHFSYNSLTVLNGLPGIQSQAFSDDSPPRDGLTIQNSKWSMKWSTQTRRLCKGARLVKFSDF
jgi:hypothetical protein